MIFSCNLYKNFQVTSLMVVNEDSHPFYFVEFTELWDEIKFFKNYLMKLKLSKIFLFILKKI